MTKLIALYKKPENVEDFEEKYFNEHMPLVKKMPGLVKSEVSRINGLGSESKFYLMAEMYFNSLDELNSAMASPEGKASAKNLMTFAKDYVSMFIGEDCT